MAAAIGARVKESTFAGELERGECLGLGGVAAQDQGVARGWGCGEGAAVDTTVRALFQEGVRERRAARGIGVVDASGARMVQNTVVQMFLVRRIPKDRGIKRYLVGGSRQERRRTGIMARGVGMTIRNVWRLGQRRIVRQVPDILCRVQVVRKPRQRRTGLRRM